MRFWKFLALFPIILLAPLKPCWGAAAKKSKQSNAAAEAALPEKPAPEPGAATSEAEQKADAKRWEARISPLATLVRWYTAEAAIHFNEHWALGPTFTAYAGSRHPFLIGLRGTAVGFFTTYYLEALPASGWYGALRIQKQKFTAYPANDSQQVIKHISGNTAELLAGYRKQMANSFFVLLGAGVQRRKYKEVEEQLLKLATEARKDRFAPYLEAKLGMDF